MIIYGTGFTATDFLAPMKIRGLDGRDLREEWGSGARAYLGVSVPHFPNLYLMYGPNTNLGSGSIVFMLECQARYVRQALDTRDPVGAPICRPRRGGGRATTPRPRSGSPAACGRSAAAGTATRRAASPPTGRARSPSTGAARRISIRPATNRCGRPMSRVHAFGDDALGEHDAVALAELVAAGEVSARELAEAAVARVQRSTRRCTRSRSRRSTHRGSRAAGALRGVPTFVKDNTDVLGMPTNHGTDGVRRPAGHDATATTRGST